MFTPVLIATALGLMALLAIAAGNLDLSAAAAAGGDAPIQAGDLPSGAQRTAPTGGSGGGPAPAPAPAPPGQGQPRQPGTAPPPAPPGSPQPGQGTPRQQPQPASPRPAAGAPGAQPQQDWTLRTQLQQLGWDTSSFQTDQAAWDAMAQRLAVQQQERQRLETIAQYGQYYLANQQAIQAAIQAQQQSRAPGQQGQPPAAKPLWSAPEWNKEWDKFIRFDGDGNPVVPVGMDPSIATKYIERKTWERNTLDSLLTDPEKLLGPIVEKLAAAKAREISAQTTGSYADHQFAQQYVAQQDWMWQRDQQGNVQRDYSGRPVLTRAAQIFQGYVQYLDSAGIKNVRQQQVMAQGLLERDVLQWQMQQLAAHQQRQQQPAAGGNPAAQPGQQQPGTGNQQQKDAALGLNGARRISGAGAQGANPPPNDALPKAQLGRQALSNRLAAAFRANNIVNVD